MTTSTDQPKGKQWLRKLFRYGIPALISIGLCWMLFTGIDFNQMLEIIRTQCDFRWIILAQVIAIVSHVLRAFRWGIQLRALGIPTPAMPLIFSIFGTYAVNLVFPRLGEIWRTGYIAARQRAPFTTVFGSMVADRLADTITVLCLTVGTFLLARNEILDFFSQNGEAYARIASFLRSPWLWAAVVVVIIAFWALMKAPAKSGGKLERIQKAFRELWSGFAVVVTMPGKGLWLLLTAGVWGCYFLQMYVAFFAFPFTAEVIANHGTLAALVTFVLASISMGVPSNGGIGPWQWAVIFALGIYGVGNIEGASFANIVLGTNTLLLIILGIITFIGIAIDKRKNNTKLNS